MSGIVILPITKDDYHTLSVMVGELLSEIMTAINEKAFNYDERSIEERAKELVEKQQYWVFMAKDIASNNIIGFVSMYESFALYSEGAYGTIPEFYVRPEWRSKSIGLKLLESAVEFANSKGWYRLEVTTPPLPEFDRTLNFYQKNEFKITGGRKLKLDLNA